MYDRDRCSVLVGCLSGMPSAAGCAAAQRLHGQLQLVSGLECLARPTVPPQAIGAVAFEIPDHGPRVIAHDFQHNERVGVGELEIPNDADQLNRVFPIEHPERVMSDRRAARRDKPGDHNEGAKIGSHGIMPFLIRTRQAGTWPAACTPPVETIYQSAGRGKEALGLNNQVD